MNPGREFSLHPLRILTHLTIDFNYIDVNIHTGGTLRDSGEIRLLRESFNPLARAQAQLPTGVADFEPPKA
jgi:hypothetical protein